VRLAKRIEGAWKRVDSAWNVYEPMPKSPEIGKRMEQA